MIYTMKKEQIFWVSVYLLLDCASAPLSAVLETEDYTDITGKILEAFIFFGYLKLSILIPKCNMFFSIVWEN